jgi:hypothetical protein
MSLLDDDGDDLGCRYIVENGHAKPCGARLKPGSSYCAEHHALCHCGAGTAAEKARLLELRAMARVAGGRRDTANRRPPVSFLERAHRAAVAAETTAERLEAEDGMHGRGPTGRVERGGRQRDEGLEGRRRHP